jgi:hypothetical protein
MGFKLFEYYLNVNHRIKLTITTTYLLWQIFDKITTDYYREQGVVIIMI